VAKDEAKKRELTLADEKEEDDFINRLYRDHLSMANIEKLKFNYHDKLKKKMCSVLPLKMGQPLSDKRNIFGTCKYSEVILYLFIAPEAWLGIEYKKLINELIKKYTDVFEHLYPEGSGNVYVAGTLIHHVTNVETAISFNIEKIFGIYDELRKIHRKKEVKEEEDIVEEVNTNLRQFTLHERELIVHDISILGRMDEYKKYILLLLGRDIGNIILSFDSLLSAPLSDIKYKFKFNGVKIEWERLMGKDDKVPPYKVIKQEYNTTGTKKTQRKKFF
jgi:hypothetical protein